MGAQRIRGRKIYELYDLDRQKLTEGNVYQVADYCHCEPSSIREAGKKSSFMKMYVVKKTDRWEEVNQKKTSEPEMTPVETMVWALKIWGNTITMFDPNPYFPELYEKEGLNCRCRKVIDPVRNDTAGRGRRPKPEVHYIVEVVNAVRTSPSV